MLGSTSGTAATLDAAAWSASAAAGGDPQPRVRSSFPPYNEAANIGPAVAEATAAADRLFDDHEILVVDDGSAGPHRGPGAGARPGRRRAYACSAMDETGATARPCAPVSSPVDSTTCSSPTPTSSSTWTSSSASCPTRDRGRGRRLPRQPPGPAAAGGSAYAWNLLVRILFYVPVRDIDCAFKLFNRQRAVRGRHESVGAMVNTELMVKLGRTGRQRGRGRRAPPPPSGGSGARGQPAGDPHGVPRAAADAAPTEPTLDSTRSVSCACAACGAGPCARISCVERPGRERWWRPLPRTAPRPRTWSCAVCGHIQVARVPDGGRSSKRPTPRSTRAPIWTEEAGQRATAGASAGRRSSAIGRRAARATWGAGWASCWPRPRRRPGDRWRRADGFARATHVSSLGLDVQTGHARGRRAFRPGAFDAVVMADVIEHLPDPGAAGPGPRAASPDGVLYPRAPRRGEPLRGALGARWWSVLPTHVQYFTRDEPVCLLLARPWLRGRVDRHRAQGIHGSLLPRAPRGVLPGAARAAVRVATALRRGRSPCVARLSRPDGRRGAASRL